MQIDHTTSYSFHAERSTLKAVHETTNDFVFHATICKTFSWSVGLSIIVASWLLHVDVIACMVGHARAQVKRRQLCEPLAVAT